MQDRWEVEFNQNARTQTPTTPASHVLLADASWGIWRWSVLRGVGFSVDFPLQLAAPDCVAVADQLFRSEQAAQETKRETVALIKAIRSENPAQSTLLTNAIHDLHKGKIPANQEFPQQMQEALAALQTARGRVETSRASLRQVFPDAVARTTGRLHELVEQQPFRQALAWQNRQVLHTALTQFLSKPVNTTSSHFRQHRMLLAKYLQRYCLKNDTIGFFGPVGWACWHPETPATTVQPGPLLLAERTTYLEGWAINALSQTLAANPAVRPWAVPRLMPYARVEGLTLHLPFVKPLPLSQAQARILTACDGRHTAQM